MNTDNNRYSISDLWIETAFVYDVVSYGETKEIDYVNPAPDIMNSIIQEGAVILFTEENKVYIEDDLVQKCVAIVVNSDMIVTKVINKAPGTNMKPNFNESTITEIPSGGFAILAVDHNYNEAGTRKFFAEKFTAGDMVKLKMLNDKVSVSDVARLSGGQGNVVLSLDGTEICTTFEDTASITGKLLNADPSSVYGIQVKNFGSHGEVISEGSYEIAKNNFAAQVTLGKSVNYIDVSLTENGQRVEGTTKNVIIFKKEQIPKEQKQVVMWIEQYVNAVTLGNAEKIENMIRTAKDAGITEFAIDVKGCEGYVAYKKATLSQSPYMTEIKNPKKQHNVDMDMDFLEDFIRIAHSYNMKVYGSFNFFVEGNISSDDYAIQVPTKHPDWAEVLQAPEDLGELRSVLDTKKPSMLLYVNPANDEVQEYQLKRAEEVLMNYDIDGIILDRTRYDNQYADFSDETKVKFEKFLADRNKSLTQWPNDVYTIHEDGSMHFGEYYYEWITFRSTVIRGFAEKIRNLVNQYRVRTNRDIKLAAYVGSWYESYYQNGVNWADDSFVYNERLNFPLPELYTREYAKASYMEYIDFLMIGCYYATEEQIEKYVTLGNILTNDKTALLGSISIPDLNTPKRQRLGFQTVYKKSNGGMIFDLCYTDWSILKPAIQDTEYVAVSE